MEVEPWPNNIKYKMNCYCDLLNEHIGNLDNILRTCKKYNKNTLEIGKKHPPPPSPNPKNKKLRPLNLLIGCMQFLFPTNL